jgi:NADH-quinone oxidoreductase subunit G
MAQFVDGQEAPETKTPSTTIYQWLADMVPELADAGLTTDFPDEGLRISSGARTDLRFRTDLSDYQQEDRVSPGNLTVILTDLTFGTEVLSARSECLRELEEEPAVIMHTSDAHSMDSADGDRVSIQTKSGRFEAKLKVVDNMAPGVLIVPRHHKISWQVFEIGISSINRQQIKKVAA